MLLINRELKYAASSAITEKLKGTGISCDSLFDVWKIEEETASLEKGILKFWVSGVARKEEESWENARKEFCSRAQAEAWVEKRKGELLENPKFADFLRARKKAELRPIVRPIAEGLYKSWLELRAEVEIPNCKAPNPKLINKLSQIIERAKELYILEIFNDKAEVDGGVTFRDFCEKAENFLRSLPDLESE